MKISDVKHVNIGGVKTACITRQQLIDLVVEKVRAFKDEAGASPLIIFDSNGQGISLANTNSEFANSLAQADIVHADGESVVKMSKWVDGPNIPERSATTDMIHDIALMQSSSLKHYLLGGQQNIVEKSAQILKQKYTNFHVAGARHGYFSGTEENEVLKLINESEADILWVGLGKPLEQKWIIKNKKKLNVAVIISCGGCFNFVTGDYKRAPQWMQDFGLEWLHRLISQPKKLLWRYLTTNPHSIYCVLKHKFKKAN